MVTYGTKRLGRDRLLLLLCRRIIIIYIDLYAVLTCDHNKSILHGLLDEYVCRTETIMYGEV